MTRTDRRDFLRQSLAWSGVVLLGERGFPADGEYLGNLTWLEKRTRPLDELYGSGLDGRLYKDLSKLTPETLVTSNDGFYVRTRASALLDATSPWTITVRGLVKEPVTLRLPDLKAHVVPQGTHLMECSGNGPGGAHGLLSAARWSGIPFGEVLKKVSIQPQATRALVSGFDQYPPEDPNTSFSRVGASWVFMFEELSSFGAFMATEMNGAPLPRDHGFPVRLIVPRWYGCCSPKWVNEIVLVDDGEPATSHMKEFATRTHQQGTPELAKDYVSASMDHSAMPVRVEKWRVDGKVSYRVVGILWGGDRPRNDLLIRFNPEEEYQPVSSCPLPEETATWSLWSHPWTPRAPGKYRIELQIRDATVRKRRLDLGYYGRSVEVSEA